MDTRRAYSTHDEAAIGPDRHRCRNYACGLWELVVERLLGLGRWWQCLVVLTVLGGTSKSGTLTIDNFAFKLPSTVSPGEKLMITNKDGVAHTVTLSKAHIDVSVPANGKAMLTAPSKAGSYAITCDYHSNMHGTMDVK